MATSKDKYDGYFIDQSEPLITVDKYFKPLTVTGNDYASILLVRLILLEPGTFQTHPDCGVGLVSRYRYAKDIDVKKLQQDIKNQIAKYLPQFTLVDVRCELGKVENSEQKVIKIYITSDELNVYLPINPENGEVLENKLRLANFR